MSAKIAVLVASIMFALTLYAAPMAAADAVVTTESGRTRCVVLPDDVACQVSGSTDPGGFLQAPISNGLHWNMATVDPTGGFRWADGNIGAYRFADDIVLNYGQTYHFAGWAILPTFDGTRFTNDRTGHGMFVSIENVYSF